MPITGCHPQNHRADLLETSQKCFLVEAPQKLLKEFHSLQNSGCHDNHKEHLVKN